MQPHAESNFLSVGGRLFTPYYAWAIYFDNAPMDVQVYGNICARNTLGGIMISHYGRNVTDENNIFVDSDNSQVYLLFAGRMSGVRFRRNIFSYAGSDADYLRLVLARECDLPTILAEHDYQLYHLPGGGKLTFGGLPGEAATRAGMDTDPQETNMQVWRAMGFDAHSVFADPMFTDPANDDYSLEPDSPAFKLGFRPIDTGRIGLIDDV